MTNKYLVKIAEKEDDNRLLKRVGGLYLSGAGAAVVAHDYHRGNLTGRETLYHGSSTDRVSSIRQHGLKPNHSGVSKIFSEDLHNSNRGRVFMTPSKRDAGMYAAQQEAINSGKVSSRDSLHGYQLSGNYAADARSHTDKSHIVRGDVPTWKPGYKKSLNPEIKAQFKAINADPLAGLFHTDGKKGVKRDVYHQFQTRVHTFNNGTGVPSKYLNGPNYQPNSFSEIKEFAKAKPNRFLKGVARSVAGVGMIGVGAKLMKDSIKNNHAKTN